VCAALTCALAALLAARAGIARASFGPIELQSFGPSEQFESATESAISGDGRYLAFAGRLAGVQGVYRKDLATGGLPELAAGGSVYQSGPGATDASAPSISADGRYVSFTSADRLVAAARTGSNVYVRDMDLPAPAAGGACSAEEEAGGRCAYELASALGGGKEGIAYGEVSRELECDKERLGAVASARVALSASGRKVAFVICGSSDLTSHDPGQLTTPPLQVVVRDLEHETTTLVSQTLGSIGSPTPEPVPRGAVTPTLQLDTSAGGARRLPGAALSADGTTVAWLGAHIAEQAPTLSDERAQIEADDKPGGTLESYDEPLWRRIAGGPAAPIRRMVGGGDPLAPGCPPGGTLAIAACRGPYPELAFGRGPLPGRGQEETNKGWLGINFYEGVPQLSADGWTAALIGDPDGSSNVFVVDMREGLNRVQALRQLTREVPAANVSNPGSRAEYVAGAGDVYELAISPDGTRMAFTTQRQQFPLAPPNFSEAPPSQVGVLELYQIDLANESLVRVTHGPDGAASLEGSAGLVNSNGAASPSYTADDGVLAFSDTAANLVFGDANGSSDVFTVTGEEARRLPGPVAIGPAPPPQEPTRAPWRLSVVPVAHRDGSLTLDVVVPGAGELSARATATVPIAVGARRKASRRGHPARGRGGSGSRPAATLAPRLLAAARRPAKFAGLVELPLRVAARYAGLLSGAGLYALVNVSFQGAGGPWLSQQLAVSLRRVARRGPAHRTRAMRGGHRAKKAR
jgi:Tol biopolymer transport system component